MEEVKKENEALKQRIRDLERQIRGNNDADGQRGRRGATQSQSSGVGMLLIIPKFLLMQQQSTKKAVDRLRVP